LWAVAVLVVFVLQLQAPIVTDLGANSSVGLFVRGEWWRPLSALFLHGDFHHLLGNVVSGCVFFTLVARSFGTWRGWGLALASGLLGNLLTTWFHHPEPFRSLGASTAVFGALGLLTGLGVRFASFGRRGLRPLAAPVGGGLMLLAWLGVGGADVDLLGHFFGFAAGFALGLLAPFAASDRREPSPP
jgi:membrane associated rhomboid family serine protease